MHKLFGRFFLIYLFLSVILSDYISYNDRVISVFPLITFNFLFYFKLILLIMGTILLLSAKGKVLSIRKNNLVVLTLMLLALLSVFLVNDVYIDNLRIQGGGVYKGYYEVDQKMNLIFTVNYIFNMFLGYILSSLYFNNDEALNKLNTVLLISYPFHFVIGLFQFLFFSGVISLNQVPLFFTFQNGNIGMRVTGIFTNPFFYGSFLLIILNILCFDKLMLNKYKKMKFILKISVFFSIIISGSKSILLIALIIIIFSTKPTKSLIAGLFAGIVTILFSKRIPYLNRLLDFSSDNASFAYRISTPLESIANFIGNNFINVFFGVGYTMIFISDLQFITIMYRFGIVYLIIYIALLIATLLKSKNMKASRFRKYIIANVATVIVLMFLLSGVGDSNSILHLMFFQYPFSFMCNGSKTNS